jgi:ATP-dependent helicase/nuclease subunit A
VALTRTQHTLVLSSLQPHIGSAGSWWERLQTHAQDAPSLPASDTTAALAPVEAAVCTLSVLPNMPLALVELAKAATKSIAIPELADTQDSLESRIGQAMHRLLERYVPAAQAGVDAAWPDATLLETTAQAFALDTAQMAQAVTMARTILHGEGAWAWDAAQLDWQGNEVGLVHQGRVLRLDRLVLRRGTDGALGQWWVLDYKSSGQPQLQDALREQLRSYRAAVAQAYPTHPVRAAFLTAQGRLIEIDTP